MAAFGDHGEEAPKRIAYTPTETVSLCFCLADLDDGPKTLYLGELDRVVTLDLAPRPVTRDIAVAYTDHSPMPGINPYWLRVVQSDMEMAWTSPLFVDYVAPDA